MALVKTFEDTFARVLPSVPVSADDIWGGFSVAGGTIAGGVWTPDTTGSRQLHAKALPNIPEGQITLGFIIGTDLTNFAVSILARATDVGEHLRFDVSQATQLVIRKISGAGNTIIASKTMVGGIVASTKVWLRAIFAGNTVTLRFYTSNPFTGGAIFDEINGVLGGGDELVFGAGILGRIAFRTAGSSILAGTPWVIDDFVLEEPQLDYTYYGNIEERRDGTAALINSVNQAFDIGNTAQLTYTEYDRLRRTLDLRPGIIAWNRSDFHWPRRNSKGAVIVG